MHFEGFPRNVRATAVPDPFFNSLLEGIDDLAEWKVTLRLLWLLGRKRGQYRYVSETELLADETLLRSLRNGGGDSADQIRHGLAQAVTRGTLVRHSSGESPEGRYYLLNTEENRRRLSNGTEDFRPARFEPSEPATSPDHGRSRSGSAEINIFDLYENNIGTFGPIMAQQLAEAEDRYPPGWIERPSSWR